MNHARPEGFYLDGEPHVEPSRLVEHFCASLGITKDDLGIRPVVLGTFNERLTRYLAEVADAARADYWSDWQGGDAFSNRELTVATFRIGAPAAVAQLEEMAACGMRVLIAAGAAGSLQPHAPIGTLVVPSSALREEGTSHHYAPSREPAVPDAALADELAREAEARGIAPLRGLHWTTDAPYREHQAKIDRHRRAGVISVDMELSAFFTVASVRAIRCAAIVAVSDELHGDAWEIGFGGEPYRRAVTNAGRIALTVAQRRAEAIGAGTPVSGA